MVEPETAGEPTSGQKWIRSSLRQLSHRLAQAGHPASPPTVSRLLKKRENISEGPLGCVGVFQQLFGIQVFQIALLEFDSIRSSLSRTADKMAISCHCYDSCFRVVLSDPSYRCYAYMLVIKPLEVH